MDRSQFILPHYHHHDIHPPSTAHVEDRPWSVFLGWTSDDHPVECAGTFVSARYPPIADDIRVFDLALRVATDPPSTAPET